MDIDGPLILSSRVVCKSLDLAVFIHEIYKLVARLFNKNDM
jgi:hypothetical protein